MSVQPGLRGSNDFRVGRKMDNFQLFFFSQVGLRTYQHPCFRKFCEKSVYKTYLSEKYHAAILTEEL